MYLQAGYVQSRSVNIKDCCEAFLGCQGEAKRIAIESCRARSVPRAHDND